VLVERRLVLEPVPDRGVEEGLAPLELLLVARERVVLVRADEPVTLGNRVAAGAPGARGRGNGGRGVVDALVVAFHPDSLPGRGMRVVGGVVTRPRLLPARPRQEVAHRLRPGFGFCRPGGRLD